MPHLSDVSHHCLDTGCAVRGSGNVCLIAEMCVCGCVWLHDFIPKFSQSPPCSWHWQILTQSNIRVPSSVFRILQPLRPVSFMRWPCLLLVTRDTPGHTLGASLIAWMPHTRGNTGHSSNLSWKLDIKAHCPNVVTSSTHSWRIQMASLETWILYLDLALDSSLFSSWAELCLALMGSAELCAGAEGLFNPHTSSWASPNTPQFYTFGGQAPHDLSPNL